MHSSIIDAFIYTNLMPIFGLSENTSLCIYEPAYKLYTVKQAYRYSKPYYEAIASIDNPHLAKILFIDEGSESINIVSEYISGDTLAELIKSNRFIPKERAVKIAAQICDGLSALHSKGLVHRDINPNNIIISSDGNVKIIDYGIVRSFSENKGSDTAILGTPGYAAPEQFGFSQSDEKTDIYAVGVLLNVMLTGGMPSEQKVNGALGKIIRKCTQIDSKRRYKNMQSLKKVLFDKVVREGPADTLIKKIPGLRSSHAIVVVLAIIAYLFEALFSVAMFQDVQGGVKGYILTSVSWIFIILIPFFCFYNFLDVWDKIPFSAGSSKRSQRIIYSFLGCLSILIGLMVFPIPTT